MTVETGRRLPAFARSTARLVRRVVVFARRRAVAFNELWKHSLQFRVTVSTLALSSAVVFVLGMVLQNQITERLLDTKRDAATAQTRAAAETAAGELVGLGSETSDALRNRLENALKKIAITPTSQDAAGSAAGDVHPGARQRRPRPVRQRTRVRRAVRERPAAAAAVRRSRADELPRAHRPRHERRAHDVPDRRDVAQDRRQPAAAVLAVPADDRAEHRLDRAEHAAGRRPRPAAPAGRHHEPGGAAGGAAGPAGRRRGGAVRRMATSTSASPWSARTTWRSSPCPTTGWPPASSARSASSRSSAASSAGSPPTSRTSCGRR